MVTYTNDRTVNAVREGTDPQTATDDPAGLDASVAPGDAPAGAASDGAKPNGIVLEALTERAIVRIEVGGEIESTDRRDDTVRDDGVVVSRIDGAGGRDSYRFSGSMVDLEVAVGDVDVALDLHGDEPAVGEGSTRLSVHAQGADVEYEFAVSGAVEPQSAAGLRDHDDGDDEAVVTGSVSGSGVDEYAITGEITAFETSTEAVLVLVDDRVVDPATLG